MTSNNITEPGVLSRFFELFGYYTMKSLIFIFIFVLFTTNLLALSLSIKINKGEQLLFKVASGMYAFMFGIIYIFVNYYMYRCKLKNNPGRICGTPFS